MDHETLKDKLHTLVKITSLRSVLVGLSELCAEQSNRDPALWDEWKRSSQAIDEAGRDDGVLKVSGQ
jgi:hypothetical protein